MNIPDEAIEAAAKAIQVEWGITPWGELSYQAERALTNDARHAIMNLASEALEAAAPFIADLRAAETFTHPTTPTAANKAAGDKTARFKGEQ